MAKQLGPLETQFFAYAQMRRMQTVRLGQAAGSLHFSQAQERKLLSQLARKGLLVRVIRGVYLVPPRLPLGGRWSPDPALVIGTLMRSAVDDASGTADQPARYQICGPNAFNHYGFDEQVPVQMYLYNNRFSGSRRIGAVALNLIKVADDRLGSTEEVASGDGKLIYSSRVRTLVDAVYDWSRFDSLPRGYQWIRQELAARRVSAADLIRDTLRFGNQGTIRRVGLLLEKEGLSEPLLRRLLKAIAPSSSPIPWIPTAPKRGSINVRWGVVVNTEGGSL